jgi:hypothetical protein
MTGCQLIGEVRLVADCKDPAKGGLGWTNGAKDTYTYYHFDTTE